MSKYHINPETGRPNQCRATKGGCPFGGDDAHHATKEEARAAYEKDMASKTLASHSKKDQEQAPTEEPKVGLAAIPSSLKEKLEAVKAFGSNIDSDGEVTRHLAAHFTYKDKGLKRAAVARAYHSATKRGTQSWDPDRMKAEQELISEISSATGGSPRDLYPATRAGVVQAMADHFRYSSLEPTAHYKSEYDAFVNKPTAANLKRLQGKSAASGRGVTTAADANGDQLGFLLKKSENFSKASKITKFYSPQTVAAEVAASEEWEAYDKKYPAAPGEDFTLSASPYQGTVPEGYQDALGYDRIENSTWRAPGAKSGPNGSSLLVSHTPKGWFVTTSNGYNLRGPFDNIETAGAASSERDLVGGTELYYD